MTDQTSSKVPQIRFKGFEGDWDDQTLGKLFPITSAARVHKHEWTKSGVPFFRSSDVVSAFMGKVNTKAFISHELYLDLSEKVGRVKKGDMLVTGGGSIGIPYLVGADDPLYFKDADLLWFKIRDSVDSHYLFTFFSSQLFTRYVRSISHIGTIAHYTVEQAKITPLAVPRIKTEQSQIGKFFRELDSLIGLHQRKHDKLVTLKKAMLQKMFPQPGATTPEIRFKGFQGDWVEKKLGECVLIQRGGSPRPIEDFTTQDADGINWIKIGDVKIGSRYITQTEEKIRPEGVSKSRQVFKGDLILSNSMSFGRPYLMAIDGCIHDGWLLIRNDRNLFDLNYLLQLLSSETMTEQYRSLAAGGVVNNLNSALVQSTNITFPDKPEQQKIGTYFRTLDELISQHATQLKKLQQIKSACLERMFV
nr:restriction endonuclease subunit S [uncultured Albidiferax sp.]